MDTHEMMAFLYAAIPPGDRAVQADREDEQVELLAEIVELAAIPSLTTFQCSHL